MLKDQYGYDIIDDFDADRLQIELFDHRYVFCWKAYVGNVPTKDRLAHLCELMAENGTPYSRPDGKGHGLRLGPLFLEITSNDFVYLHAPSRKLVHLVYAPLFWKGPQESWQLLIFAFLKRIRKELTCQNSW